MEDVCGIYAGEAVGGILLGFFTIFFSQPVGNVQLAFALVDGLFFFVIFSIFRTIHANPGISLSVFFSRRQPVVPCLLRIVPQIAGCLIGGVLSLFIMSPEYFSLSLMPLRGDLANGYQMFILDVLLTAIICMCFLSGGSPMIMGSGRALCSFVSYRVSGYSANLSVHLSMCIVRVIRTGDLSTLSVAYLWVFSCLLGSGLGALIYRVCGGDQ